MKVILTALNSKYIHSNLAIRSISKYCSEYEDNISVMEFTINNHEDYILSELIGAKPDIICFSCYIWNIKMTLEIIYSIKKILEDVIIILGGPEVSFDAKELLQLNESIDIIVIGEGEQTIKEILCHYIENGINLLEIKNILYRTNNGINQTSARNYLSLDSIPFIYDENELINLQNKIIYYESSRGCSFRCSYCLSSTDNTVRLLSIQRVYSDLKFFLDNNIVQCKFVDRTFNNNIKRAMNIWQFIIDNDNNVTNFHFEIAADILNSEAIEILSRARKGLFQFEIGIQSTNVQTLESIKRKADFNVITKNIIDLKKNNNIHIHLDLIAGLPYEDYSSFSKSFNDVYNLEPDQLQLGFLKLLKGCEIRYNASDYGIIYKKSPPYEVLKTRELSYENIMTLKIIEDLIEKYYNSNKAKTTLKYIIQAFDAPFLFYESLSKYWKENKHHTVNHNKLDMYNILFEFCNVNFANEINIIKDLLKFDLLINDNIKNFPYWIDDYNRKQLKEKVRQFCKKNELLPSHLNTIEIGKKYNIDLFSFDIPNWLKNSDKAPVEVQTAILFDYTNSVTGQAVYRELPLS